MHWIRTLITLLTLSLMTVACATTTRTTFNKPPSSDAEAAYRQALATFEDGDHDEAAQMFQRLKLTFPYAKKWISLSELRIADIYLDNNQEELAAATYRIFVKTYPTHPEVHYALFKVGIAYKQLMPSDIFILPDPWQRELKTAKQAEIAFDVYLKRFPKGQYAEEARKNLAEIQDRLVKHELYVAEYNFKQKAYYGTVLRTKHILKYYAYSSLLPQTLLLLANAYLHLNDPYAATKYLTQLTQKYPDSEYAEQAKAWLSQYKIPAPKS